MYSFWALTLGACLVFDVPDVQLPAAVHDDVQVDVQVEREIVLPDVFDRIVFCESSGDPEAQNPTSTASGLYQFIYGTWVWVWEDLKGEEPPAPEAWKASVYDQTRAAKTLYLTMGLTPWYASKHCWGK